MAVYGLSLYGQDVYGLPGFGARAGLGFSASSFTAEPVAPNLSGQYGQVLLRWDPPVGDWDNLRIMRRFSGFPTNVVDGELVFSSTKGESIKRYVDTDLTEGIAVYYTLFVQAVSNDVWFTAGEAWSLVVEDHGFHGLLLDALPDAALIGDYEYSQILPEERKHPLSRFMEVPAFMLDEAKTFLKTLQSLYNPDVTPAQALPLLAQQFGIVPEPSIGVTRLRTIARNAAFLNAKRGTVPGVEALASAFTGWGATVTTGVNLALNDTHEHWSADGTATVDPASSTPHSDAHFGVTLGDANPVRLRSADVAGREKFYSVPVDESTSYVYSFEVRSNTGLTETFTPVLRYYDSAGAFLSEASGTGVASTDSAWTSASDAFTTPANTAFVELAIDLTAGAVNDEHYFKNVQLEAGASFTSYEPPRQAVITFDAPYTNHITTPSFEDAVTPAFTVTNATTAFSAAEQRVGADSWSVSPDTLGVDTVVESNDTMPLQAGDPALLRASIKPVTTDVDVTAEIVWLDGADAEVGTVTQVFSLTADTWNDFFLNEQAPGGATKAKIRFTWQDVDIFLDGVGLIDSYGVDYFDGSTLAGETLWEGTDHNSVSYYFPLRTVRQARLNAVLPTFLPLGRKFELKYGTSS